jgi:hypothetical protein
MHNIYKPDWGACIGKNLAKQDRKLRYRLVQTYGRLDPMSLGDACIWYHGSPKSDISDVRFLKRSFKETPAQMAMTNLFSPIKDDWRFVISTFTIIQS